MAKGSPSCTCDEHLQIKKIHREKNGQAIDKDILKKTRNGRYTHRRANC